MPRPDPALLDPARYPFSCEIPTRYGDMDPNQHLNNVAVAAMAEEARVRFNWGSGVPAAIGADRGVMAAGVSIDYLAQAFYPQPVTGFVALETVGRSSWTLVQILVQDGRVFAFSRAVMVCVQNHRSAVLPDGFACALEASLLRPASSG